jgi:tetratricopeptide (TPR) repeat protein
MRLSARPSRTAHLNRHIGPSHQSGFDFSCWPRWLASTSLVAAVLATPAWAQVQPPVDTQVAVNNSALDAETFYQLFISELELRRGEAGVAYQVMLDAARRTRDDQLFKRAVDMAISARAPEQALTALKQWRQTLPKSRMAPELQAQVLMALGRPQEAREPIRTLIELTPSTDRARTITALAGLVVRGDKATAAAGALDEVLKPWKEQSATRVSALLASSRAWLAAADNGRALTLAQDAQRLEPGAETAALVGLELFGQDPRAEQLVLAYDKTPQASAAFRLVHARRLTAAQRYPEALATANAIITSDPEFAPAWLMQGALQIELAQTAAARESLTHFLSLKDKASADNDDDDVQASEDAAAAHQSNDEQERNQAYLMLAQASEQLKDYASAQQWLERLGNNQSSSAVVLRRASLLANQGKLDEARALIRALPEQSTDDTRAKIMGETQLLRNARQWLSAYEVLTEANRTLPDDPDLIYEQALLAEKLLRFDEMERLLRRVIEIKPDQQHAYNALGYSLADRGQRLVEARQLVAKALELAPGDPFITDSLGWIEFRLGRVQEALALLQGAYRQRPDVEIGAHLGEVLWSLGQQDEARKIWRAGHARDANNEVLAETLARLKVGL